MKAHELLSDESKWCQKTFAVDAHGVSIHCDNPRAVAWCLDGALLRCYLDARASDRAAYRQVANAIRAGGPGTLGGVSAWNDAPGRTYAEVYALLKRLDI